MTDECDEFEPVAWRFRGLGHGTWGYTESPRDEWTAPWPEFEPLYAAPVDARDSVPLSDAEISELIDNVTLNTGMFRNFARAVERAALAKNGIGTSSQDGR